MKKAPLKKNSSAGAPAEVMTVDNIGRLAGGIAHDLNTILTTIYGYSELALESVDKSSEAGLSIMKITEAADKARELTEQLLNLQLSKRQEKPVVRLNDIITETVNFVRLSLRGNIEVTTRMTSWDLYVEADPIQLFRVFLNLTVNATQAMEKDGGRLTISLGVISGRPGKEPSEHSTARVRFADTGKGMDQRTSSRIFEPYFTAGKEGKGTGLGLSVAGDIISGINGEIKVFSEPGKGTVIDVIIPVTTMSAGQSREKRNVSK